MGRQTTAVKHGGISSEAVKRATGRDWDQWLRLLDEAGARDWTHKAIARWISDNHTDVSDWWAQMITVGYERARGKRAEHEKSDGFAISASKTVAASTAEAYQWFRDARRRKRWLPDAPQMKITTANEAKNLRIAWDGNTNRVSVHFWQKGPEKCQVAVQHEKLPDQGDAKRMQQWWRDRLAGLAELLSRS